LQYIKIENLKVSRFIIGGNPFSGFSHQGQDRDVEMLDYYSIEHVKQELKKAEALGINTNLSRSDNYIVRVLREYRNEGGNIQWFAQTASEMDLDNNIQNAIDGKAKACYIHGGVMDNYYANGKMYLILPMIKKIKDAGLCAGIAGHRPEVFDWAEENLDCNFYMCCYYNPIYRDDDARHRRGLDEKFREEDRVKMLDTIQHLSKPVIHYKILAAGRNDPEEAFKLAAKAMRPQDAVCVGIFSKDDPLMLQKDVKLFEKYVINA
jgi:hypothetical protein